jgi:hypothetical protein
MVALIAALLALPIEVGLSAGPGFANYGVDNIPAQSNLSASALALMFSLDFAPTR